MTEMPHTRCGRSGLMLPRLSFGCWYNFGDPAKSTHGLGRDEATHHANARSLILTAWEAGITHFDTANGYGPPAGASEQRLGRILKELPRDEYVVSTKAGYQCWQGPHGRGGSAKHLLASLERSLTHLDMDYVDVFIHHCPDPETPIEETMATLHRMVTSGKARYVGLSSYNPMQTAEAFRACRENGITAPIYHQSGYSLIDRLPEVALLDTARACGMGYVSITTLAQGRLTAKYLDGVPADSRMGVIPWFAQKGMGPDLVPRLRAFAAIAAARGQSIAQCALAWALRNDRVTSVLLGASRPEQLTENLGAMANTTFSSEETAAIDALFPPGTVNGPL